MALDIDPVVDNWYMHLDKGQRFTITEVNEDDETIELQHFDGDIDEITFSDWSDYNVELCEAPENWSGPIDIGTVDDYGTEITDTSSDDWNEPLQDFSSTGETKSMALKNDQGEGQLKEQPLEI